MDVSAFLVWLSGAGVSAVSAYVLERLDGFGSLSPQGKQTIATLVAVLIAVGAMAAHDWLAANPSTLTATAPYLQIAITAVSILIQQTAHAVQRSAGGDHG